MLEARARCAPARRRDRRAVTLPGWAWAEGLLAAGGWGARTRCCGLSSAVAGANAIAGLQSPPRTGKAQAGGRPAVDCFLADSPGSTHLGAAVPTGFLPYKKKNQRNKQNKTKQNKKKKQRCRSDQSATLGKTRVPEGGFTSPPSAGTSPERSYRGRASPSLKRIKPRGEVNATPHLPPPRESRLLFPGCFLFTFCPGCAAHAAAGEVGPRGCRGADGPNGETRLGCAAVPPLARQAAER